MSTQQTPNAAAGLTKLTEVIKPLLIEVSAEHVKYTKEYFKEETEKLTQEILAENKKVNDKLIISLDVILNRLDVIDAAIDNVSRLSRNDDSQRRKIQTTLDNITDRLVYLEGKICGTNTGSKKQKLVDCSNVRYRDEGPSKNMFEHDDDLGIDCD